MFTSLIASASLDGGAIAGIIIGVIAAVALIIAVASIRIVREKTACTVERLGKYNRTLNSGLRFIIPFFERISNKVSLKEQVADFPPQPVITKDNVTMHIDTVVYYSVTDPKLYTYGVENPRSALENLSATTLRNIVGDLELDDTLTSRDTVNSQLCIILDQATDPWGIKVNRVELKNILPPKDIQDAMEKQMRAERERREQILKAEGEKKSSILVAEGEKQAQILRAEAEKATQILRAEAKKAELIAHAEGEKQAIEMIIKANPNAAYVTLQGFEALKKLAEGQATKIIVPSELQNVSALLTSMTEVVKDPDSKKS